MNKMTPVEKLRSKRLPLVHEALNLLCTGSPDQNLPLLKEPGLLALGSWLRSEQDLHVAANLPKLSRLNPSEKEPLAEILCLSEEQFADRLFAYYFPQASAS